LVPCRYLNAELLVASLYAPRKSCDLVTLSRLYVAFHGPKTNVKLVPQIDVAWCACHAAPPSGNAVSPHACPSNTKLSPDAELHCCALPSHFTFFIFQRSSLLPSTCFYQKDKRALSANFPIHSF